LCPQSPQRVLCVTDREDRNIDVADDAVSQWFKGTVARSTVTVDGLDQVSYRPGRPKGPLPRATLLGRFQSDTLDLSWGEAVSPCDDAVHQRRILFVAGEYWVIEDRLIGARPHRYDLRFHLTPDASSHAVAYGGGHPAVWAPGLALVFGAPHKVALQQGRASPSSRGWDGDSSVRARSGISRPRRAARPGVRRRAPRPKLRLGDARYAVRARSRDVSDGWQPADAVPVRGGRRRVQRRRARVPSGTERAGLREGGGGSGHLARGGAWRRARSGPRRRVLALSERPPRRDAQDD